MLETKPPVHFLRLDNGLREINEALSCSLWSKGCEWSLNHIESWVQQQHEVNCGTSSALNILWYGQERTMSSEESSRIARVVSNDFP